MQIRKQQRCWVILLGCHAISCSFILIRLAVTVYYNQIIRKKKERYGVARDVPIVHPSNGFSGTVELHTTTVSDTEDMVTDQYRIVDHGIGMSKEFLQHLYEPFVQEGRVEATHVQGSGLGMSIVKKLVDLMGGEIEVESDIDAGTTVTLVMKYPVYKGETKEQSSGKKSEQYEYDFNGMRVLLCEDHPLNRQIVVQLLKKQGIQIDTAENGKIGLEIFEHSEEGYYHVILMDVRMPVMDGIATARAIRNLDKADALTVPILAMTANAFEEDKKETQQAGMNEHLAKPVEPAKLYQTLAKYYHQS